MSHQSFFSGLIHHQSTIAGQSNEEPEDVTVCNKPCHLYNTCGNCTDSKCMWCGNQRRCVESISYVASFPYGQCMEWTTQRDKCPCKTRVIFYMERKMYKIVFINYVLADRMLCLICQYNLLSVSFHLNIFFLLKLLWLTDGLWNILLNVLI